MLCFAIWEVPSKIRFFRDGRWRNWRYELRTITGDNSSSEVNISDRLRIISSESIEELARKLSSSHNLDSVELMQYPPIKLYNNLWSCVVLNENRAHSNYSQRSCLSDDELATLAELLIPPMKATGR